MGAQIGCEYALSGHEVVAVARHPEAARERIERGLALAQEAGYPSAQTRAARQRIDITTSLQTIPTSADIVVESLPEEMETKVAAVLPAAGLCSRAIIASNTSSLSISELGMRIGAPTRTVGTHYWNPPLLMPLVEVIRGEGTDDAAVERITQILTDLGKRPVLVKRDVPGFVWNRMQLALLREAVWLVEQGVATPETVDEIVRDGLARRWRFTGPFETAALGGAETFERIAANLFPVLSGAERLSGLRRWLDEAPSTAERVRRRRDHGLVSELNRDQASADLAIRAGGTVGQSDRTERGNESVSER